MGSYISRFPSIPPSILPAGASSPSHDTIPPSSLSGWILTSTQDLVSALRIFISRLLPAEVREVTRRRPDIDFIPPLHTTYVFLTGLLIPLINMKYQGSGTNPFKEHPTQMMLFLVAIIVYIIALITLRFNRIITDGSAMLMLGVCHLSGALSCELLLSVLVSPMMLLLINGSSLALIVMVLSCYYKYFLHAEGTEISQTEGGREEGASSQMVDLEALTAVSND
ncbi:hypothetical protein K1719_019791 [Acacia pycnantha]|nr:hypothetical protein K1719_019791 [Acacia pycnantha]